MLPVLGAVLLMLQPGLALAKKKHHQQDEPTAPAASSPPAQGSREPPRPAQNISVDRVIEQVERRYKARVVRVDKTESNGRLIYVLRLLSDQGRVWTVRVDAETGSEI